METVPRYHPRWIVGANRESKTMRNSLLDVAVLRWGDTSVRSERWDSSLTAVQTNPVYQSLIATGTGRGSLVVFRNEFSSSAPVTRSMVPETLVSGGSSAHQSRISGLCFLEEHVLVSGSLDGFIRVWHCSMSGSMVEVTAVESRDGITSMIAPNGMGESGVVVTGSKGGSIHVRDLRFSRGEADKAVVSGCHSVTFLAVKNSTNILVSGDSQGSIEMRDLRSLRVSPILKFNKHAKEPVETWEFLSEIKNRKRERISEDLWDIAMGRAGPVDVKRKGEKNIIVENKPASEASAHKGNVSGIFFDDPGSILTVGEGDNCVKRFCIVSGNLVSRVALRDPPLSSCLVNNFLLIGDRNGLQIFDRNGLRRRDGNGISNPHSGSITCMSASGELGFCTGGKDMHVFLHSIEDVV